MINLQDNMPERPHLLNYVNKPLKIQLQDMFNAEIREAYEETLYQVKRWSHSSTLPIRPGFKESNLEHTAGMLDILNEWNSKHFKYLPARIDYRQTALMIIMHDSGEAIVGDAPSQGPLRESPFWVRRKRQEPKMAQRYILSLIPDEKVRQEMEDLYHRFEKQNPNDLEALATRFLDKIQGTTRTGPKYIFDYKAAGLEKPSPDTTKHVRESLRIATAAAINLHKALPVNEAREELRFFAILEIAEFEQIGYEDLAKENIDRLNNLGL